MGGCRLGWRKSHTGAEKGIYGDSVTVLESVRMWFAGKVVGFLVLYI